MNNPKRSARANRKKQTNLILGLVIVGLVAAITVGIVLISNAVGGDGTQLGQETLDPSATDQIDPGLSNEQVKAQNELLAQTTFYEGIVVDGVNIGGMKREEALIAVENSHQAEREKALITLSFNGQKWKFTDTQMQMTYNTEEVLDTAYQLGRVGSRQQKLNEIEQLKEKGATFTTQADFNLEGIFAQLEEIAHQVSTPVKEAGVKSFDPKAETAEKMFTYEAGQDGMVVETEDLANQIGQLVDTRTFGEIEIKPELVHPTMTLEQIKANTKLVGTAYTTATWNPPRDNNIRLASDCVNGTILMPGEEFSINEKTGERTPAKGYKEANAIINGKLQPEFGGGVCQVSTTLYLAVLKADLEITSRSNHSMRSAYIEGGLDATINYPTTDFKFKNNKDMPIYVRYTFIEQKLTFEIYGPPLADGAYIKLRSELIETIAKPADIEKPDPTLPFGERKLDEENPGRPGYRYKAFKVFYDKNDKVIKEEELRSSTYRAVADTYLVGTGTPEPSMDPLPPGVTPPGITPPGVTPGETPAGPVTPPPTDVPPADTPANNTPTPNDVPGD